MRFARWCTTAQLIASLMLPAGVFGPAVGWAQQLEEIVVTARKREENLQQVPISITAFDAQGLRERNIQNVYQLTQFTPNFNLSRNLGRRLDSPIIRGQFGPLLDPAGPNASFFVDGVYVSGSASNLTIDNLERIEVLRGPQAALFGRATFSGAVNYITRKPTNEFEGQVNARAGSDEDYKLAAWASGPIVRDKLLFFVSGTYDSFGGEWRNDLRRNDANTTTDPSVSQDFFNGPRVWSLNVQLDENGNPICPQGYIPFDQFGVTAADPGCPLQQGDSSNLGGERAAAATIKLTATPTEAFELNFKVEYIDTKDDHFPALYFGNLDRNDPDYLDPNLNCFRPADADTGFPGDPGAGPLSPGWFCGEVNASGLISKLNIPDFRGVSTCPPGRLCVEIERNPDGTPVRDPTTNRFIPILDADGNFIPTIKSAPAPFVGRETETWRYLLEGIYDWNDWQLVGRLNYTDFYEENTRDLDRSYALGPVATGLFEQSGFVEDEDRSVELKIISPADNRLSGLLGYYYYKLERQAFIRDFNGFGRIEHELQRESEIENRAVFGTIGYRFSDQWSATIDARYAEDTPLALSSNGVTAEETFYSFTPRFTLEYQPRDRLNFYVQAAKGNKPGGYNTFAFFDSDVAAVDTLAGLGENCTLPNQDQICGQAVIEEEEAWTYEIGAKTTWLDGRVLFNAGLFYIDWENQGVDVTAFIPTNRNPITNPNGVPLQSNNVVDNVGKSHVLGSEIEVSWQATDDLFLSLAYGLAATEIDEYLNQNLANLTGGDGDVSGNESPRTPKHSLNIGANYTRGINADLGWFARTDLTYESKKWSTVSNLAHSGEMYIWNTWAGLESERWTLSFYVDNILDDDTATLVNDFPLFDISKIPTDPSTGLKYQDPASNDLIYRSLFLVTPRRGRNYGVTLQWRFGG